MPAPAPMAGPGVVLREIRRGGVRFFHVPKKVIGSDRM